MSVEILVSLRTAASAEAPSTPMWLKQRLQSMGEVGAVRDEACQWALTEGWGYGLGLGLGLGLMAYSRLRTDIAAGSMKASSVAPVTPMPDSLRSNSSIASSSRSRSTGTPCTLPDAAQATAASSSSCGG